jgi:hypothetical protein
MFHRNILPTYSRSKNKPNSNSKKQVVSSELGGLFFNPEDGNSTVL